MRLIGIHQKYQANVQGCMTPHPMTAWHLWVMAQELRAQATCSVWIRQPSLGEENHLCLLLCE